MSFLARVFVAAEKPPHEYLESLLLWIRARPEMYCPLVGELDSVLWYLHMVWAKVADREREYRSALESAGLKPHGIVKDEERHMRVNSDDEATRTVLEFWSRVDQALQLQVRVDGWNHSEESS